MANYRSNVCSCWRCAGTGDKYDSLIHRSSGDSEYYRGAFEEEREEQEEQQEGQEMSAPDLTWLHDIESAEDEPYRNASLSNWKPVEEQELCEEGEE